MDQCTHKKGWYGIDTCQGCGLTAATIIAQLEAELGEANAEVFRWKIRLTDSMNRSLKAEASSSRLLRECEGLREELTDAIAAIKRMARDANEARDRLITANNEKNKKLFDRALSILDMIRYPAESVEGYYAALSRQEPAPKPEAATKPNGRCCDNGEFFDGHACQKQPSPAAPNSKELSAEVLEALKWADKLPEETQLNNPCGGALKALAAAFRRLHKMNQESHG